MTYRGLTHDEVVALQMAGKSNRMNRRSSRSLGEIIRVNVFTRFNLIITVLAAFALLFGGGLINVLFFGTMVINAMIGIIQEWRAKQILDKAAILADPRATVVRDGRRQSVELDDIVLNDVIALKLGDQVPVDGIVLESDELEVNESLLTGESDPIAKFAKDQVLSGAMVVAGSGLMKATRVGADAYAATLVAKAKQFKPASSEVMVAINKLLKWISYSMIIVVPVLVLGVLLSNGLGRVDLNCLVNNLLSNGLRVITPIVSMIPEGLVLLSSTAFMLAAVKLIRNNTLAQQMPAIETLARVNTVLLDKTGTITSGKMRFIKIEYFSGSVDNSKAIRNAVKTLASRAESPTNQAICKGITHKPCDFDYEVAFSSSRKWSAITIDQVHYIMGAPEIVLEHHAAELERARILASQGYRVLAVSTSALKPRSVGVNFKRTQPNGLVIIQEQVRQTAKSTLNYLRQQGVEIKIISGDSTATVAAIAQSVGLNVRAFDARKLPNPGSSVDNMTQFTKIVLSHNVFGRVQPEQKKQICCALQAQGQVVAMTGDGVNDALALKQSDLGIAMNNGAAATKAVAELILLDNDFAHLPLVMQEGRRVIANIERVASLFVIKNVYSLILSLALIVFSLPYPLLPLHMTVISDLSIGIPAFCLALSSNNRIYCKGFLRRVLAFALPVGAATAVVLLLTYLNVNGSSLLGREYLSSATSIVAMVMGMVVLLHLVKPIKVWKLALVALCSGMFATVLASPRLRELFQYKLHINLFAPVLLYSVVGTIAIVIIAMVSRRLLAGRDKIELC